MAMTENERGAADLTISDVLGRTRLVQAVLARLDARARIDSLAREIYDGLVTPAAESQAEKDRSRFATKWAQGEMDVTTYCSYNPKNPKTTVSFDCASDLFSCKAISGGGGFECAKGFTFNCSEDVTFNNCAGQSSGFSCTTNFKCNTWQVYDCFKYRCGTKTTDSKFGCDTEFDFQCAGLNFGCYDDFDCTAGHIFACRSNNNCVDSFDCNATGNPNCVQNNDYARRTGPNGGKDTTAGDFACGTWKGTADGFQCSDKFDCKSVSDFECSQSTTFTCGSGIATNHFDCSTMTSFNCSQFNAFDCTPPNKFTCSNQTSKYTPLTPPSSSTPAKTTE